MHDHYDVAIIGGGVAAGACATTLRDEGFTGSIAVFCSEPHPPYTRPGLSKGVLRGEKPVSAAYWRPAEWYTEHAVDLHAGDAVTTIDPLGRSLRVAGRTIGWDTLVLATGAEPTRLPVGDAPADRVHVLRAIPDRDALHPNLGDGTRWLVLGGGFIGVEFATSARMTGSEVELVMLEQTMWEHVFGPTVGRWVHEGVERQGVTVHAGARVAGIGADADGDGVQMQLEDGTTLTGDHLVIGVGVQPSIGLAAQAGLDLAERGVACDATLRALRGDTPLDHVYVAGDIAAWNSTRAGGRTRIEHWDVARGQGAHVAARINRGDAAGDYDPVPYFFTGLGDWAYLELVGGRDEGGSEVVRGALDAEGAFTVAWLDGARRLTGAVVSKRDGEKDAARELVAEGAAMDAAKLADPRIPLADARA